MRISRRARRLRLRVLPFRIEVVVPRGVAPRGRAVRRFVATNTEWLIDSRERANRQYLDDLTRRFEPGAKVPFRGEVLRLVVSGGATRRRVRPTGDGKLEVDLVDSAQVLDDEPDGPGHVRCLEATRDAVESWLKREARKQLLHEAPQHLERLDVEASSIRLGNNRRAWGTCSGRGVVRVHWRLVQAPPEAMSYVIAHEVAHLAESNHSPAFWRTLERTLPSWQSGKSVLEAWEKEGGMAQ